MKITKREFLKKLGTPQGPIGGVESGGVSEICEGHPFFATGGTPVVPVAHRMPIGALMSGFEKPPRGRRLCPRRRSVDRATVGNVKMWNCGSVKVWKYEHGLGLRQIPPRGARRARGSGGSRTGT